MAHTGPIHHSSVNVVHICTYNNVSECPLYEECHVSMAVKGIHIVFVVVGGSVESAESSKLHF